MSKVVLYSRPFCPFCELAKRLLSEKGQEWEEIDIQAEARRHSEMQRRSGRPTVPQIWIGELHVGGYDDLAALDAAGELDVLFERGSVEGR